MPDSILYLLKVNLAIILFYVGYRLLLRKLTFYTLNRFYLLFALLFSFTYPLVNLAWLVKAPAQELAAEVVYIIPDWEQVPAEAFNGWPLLIGMVGLGAVWFAARLLMRLLSLRRIHGQSRAATWHWFRYREVFVPIRPFSFWQNIYVNVTNHAEGELGEIFRHEQVHVSELHTVDVLLAELCSVLCWFNPGMWLLRHAIRENLEFVTDRNVLRTGIDKQTYQYNLLGVGRQLEDYPVIAQGFNFKNLKMRIMMMNKKTSSQLQLGRYLLAVPVIAVFVLLFTMSRAAYSPDAGGNEGVAGSAEKTVAIGFIPDQPEHQDEPKSQEEPKSEGVRQTAEAPVVRTIKSSRDTTVVKLVRGVSSDQRDPLFVLDGQIVEGKFELNAMDPNTIDRIEVFKDSSARALYGQQGANGVVVITSKTKAQQDTAATKLNTKTLRGIQVIGHKQGASNITPENEPLAGGDFQGAFVVIDGEESTAASLPQLSPDEIKSIKVLKGKKATDKYGDKGKKGVIEVATTYSHSLPPSQNP